MLTITVIKLIGFKLCSFTIICIIAIRFFSEAVFISAQASLSSCSTVSDYTTRRLTLAKCYRLLESFRQRKPFAWTGGLFEVAEHVK